MLYHLLPLPPLSRLYSKQSPQQKLHMQTSFIPWLLLSMILKTLYLTNHLTTLQRRLISTQQSPKPRHPTLSPSMISAFRPNLSLSSFKTSPETFGHILHPRHRFLWALFKKLLVRFLKLKSDQGLQSANCTRPLSQSMRTHTPMVKGHTRRTPHLLLSICLRPRKRNIFLRLVHAAKHSSVE